MSSYATPFPSLDVALACAFSDERHTSGRPAMARAADDRLGEPGPLTGMDGAAEMGKARQFLERGLAPLHFAALYAKHGRRRAQCKHCGSQGDHLEWLAALRVVSSHLADFLAMRSVTADLRFDLVRRYFDENWAPSLEQMARRHDCSDRSVERASSRTADWLRGTRKKRPGEDPVYGVEQAAHAVAEKILRDGGYIP